MRKIGEAATTGGLSAHAHDVWPVKTVARMTGLTADVIRAWEKRYGVVAPQRGPRGARLYTAGDIARLRLLGQAVSAGRAIGDVAALDGQTLQQMVGMVAAGPVAEAGWATARTAQSDAADPAIRGVVDRVLEAVGRFDAGEVERVLREALLAVGSRDFARRLAPPLLHTVGELWSDGILSIADEHLVSAAMRHILSSLLRPQGRNRRVDVLVATPSGEHHECGLLLAALALTESGLGVCYLGIDLPADEIIAAARRTDVLAVGIGVVSSANRARAVAELSRVVSRLQAGVEVWLGGADAAPVGDALSMPGVLVVDHADKIDVEARRLSQLRRS
jgi:DNA-binding transcriptional MerR regulator/methylmalonyl-CoA mutase cobalamin-binding subunit